MPRLLTAVPPKFYPGATYMLSIFYTRKGTHTCAVAPVCLWFRRSHHAEVATRIALLYCAQILATGFSGLIAAGIFEGLDGVRGIAGWRCKTTPSRKAAVRY